jgi:hypothetical protein
MHRCRSYLQDVGLSEFYVPRHPRFPFSPCQGEAAPWHGTPLLSYAPSSPTPLLLASMSSAPALRPITSAQTVATITAQHFNFPNPASSQQHPSHAAQHVLLHRLNASAQAESPRSPPSTPQTPITPTSASTRPRPHRCSTPSPSPSSSSTLSSEPPAAGPSSLAGV